MLFQLQNKNIPNLLPLQTSVTFHFMFVDIHQDFLDWVISPPLSAHTGKHVPSGIRTPLHTPRGTGIVQVSHMADTEINPLKSKLNPICYLLALLGADHFLHVSRIRVKLLNFRLLMSYIYGAPILDLPRSRTTTQHSR